MSENRDREMQFEVDRDVQAVLEFMQTNIPAVKLVGVAESVAQMGRLLWSHNPQEPVLVVSLSRFPIKPCARQSNANVSADAVDADGDSAVVVGVQQPL
jgi:hypothetical protein